MQEVALMLCDSCQGPVRPVVGVDIDGTMAMYHMAFFQFACNWLGLQPGAMDHLVQFDGSQDIATFMGLDKRTYREIKLAYRQGGMKRSMPAFPGAGEFANFLRANDVDIWINTTRPYLQVGNIDDDTREWLRRNGIAYDHVIYDDDKYRRLLEQAGKERIVCTVEDQLEDYHRGRELGIDVVFIRTRFNAGAVPAGDPYVVNSLAEATVAVQVRLANWRTRNGAT
jgi:phosphoglycolate phosphatase-like HAD superfamily hydrolase